jgi:hypothetical protein
VVPKEEVYSVPQEVKRDALRTLDARHEAEGAKKHAFVQEGQADSSQTRSAWNHRENRAGPAGRLNESRAELRSYVRRFLPPLQLQSGFVKKI